MQRSPKGLSGLVGTRNRTAYACRVKRGKTCRVRWIIDWELEGSLPAVCGWHCGLRYALSRLATAWRRKHLHVVSPNFGDIPPYTIPIIISTSTELSFNIKFITLVDILFHRLSQLAPQHHIVPFRTFRHLCPVLQRISALCCGQAQRTYSHTLFDISHFGLCPYVAYQHYFV